MATKTLSIQIKASDGATRTIFSVNASILALAKNAAAMVGGLAGGAGKLLGMLTSVKAMVTGLIAVLATRAVANSILETVDQLDQLAKIARRLGIDAEALSVLKYQAGLAGIEFESLAKALQFGQKNLGDFVATGKGSYLEWQQRLGVTLADQNGNLRDIMALLPELAAGFSKLAPDEQVRAATDIFGKSGAEMLQLFKEGPDAMARMAQEARALGVVFNQDQFDAAERMADAVDRVKAAWQGVKVKLVEEIEPVVTPILNGMAERTAAIPDFIKSFSEVLGKAAAGGEGGAEAAQQIRAFFGALFDVGTKAMWEGIKLLFITLIVAARIAWAAVAPDAGKIGQDVLFTLSGGWMGEKDVAGEKVKQLKEQLRGMYKALGDAQKQVAEEEKFVAGGGVLFNGGGFAAENARRIKEGILSVQKEINNLLTSPGQALSDELMMAEPTLVAAVENARKALEEPLKKLSESADKVLNYSANIKKHSLPPPPAPSPAKEAGDDADEAARKLERMKTVMRSIHEMNQDLHVRHLAATGDDAGSGRAKLLLQQATEIKQAVESLGKHSTGYVFQLKEVHAEELKAFDIDTKAVALLKQLERAEGAYRSALDARTDAVTTGAITQGEANESNRQDLQSLLSLATEIQRKLADLATANPELAKRLEEYGIKAADTVSSVRRAMVQTPGTSALDGMSEGFRQLKQEANDFYSVGREGVTTLARGFSTDLAGAIIGAIQGTESFGKAAKKMFASLLSQVSQLILQFLVLRAIMGIASAFASSPALPVAGTGGNLDGAVELGHMATGAQVPGFNRGGMIDMTDLVRSVPRFAGGGMMPGPDINQDTVLAAMTGGEGVLNRGAMRRFGVGRLNYLNAGGDPSMMGGGGGDVHVHLHMAPGTQTSPQALQQIEEAAARGTLRALQTKGRYRDQFREVLRA